MSPSWQGGPKCWKLADEPQKESKRVAGKRVWSLNVIRVMVIQVMVMMSKLFGRAFQGMSVSKASEMGKMHLAHV
jgi:hypothetical protein